MRYARKKFGVFHIGFAGQTLYFLQWWICIVIQNFSWVWYNICVSCSTVCVDIHRCVAIPLRGALLVEGLWFGEAIKKTQGEGDWWKHLLDLSAWNDHQKNITEQHQIIEFAHAKIKFDFLNVDKIIPPPRINYGNVTFWKQYTGCCKVRSKVAQTNNFGPWKSLVCIGDYR